MKEFSRSTNTQHAYLLVTQWICSCGDCEKFSLKHFRANFFELKKIITLLIFELVSTAEEIFRTNSSEIFKNIPIIIDGLIQRSSTV